MESIHDPEKQDGSLSYKSEISALSFITKSIFDQPGKLLRKDQYTNRGVLEWQSVYTYDDVGRMLEMVSYHFRAVATRRVCKYGTENLGECNDYLGDGKNTGRQIARVDSSGYKTVSDYLVIRGELTKISEKIFNQNGDNVKNSYFSNGRLVAQEEIQFDRHGNPVESTRSDFLKESQRITQIKFDDKNNPAETLILDGNFLIESKIVTHYNDQHQVLQQLTYGIRGNLKESVQHLYEHDEFGQWIKDVTLVNKKPVSVRVRKLEYF